MVLHYVPLGLSFMSPFANIFGWLLSQLNAWLGNYGLSVIVFTVLLHILSFPLGLKQQKNMLRQTALRDDINEIKRRYPDDMQKQNELQMELMREHGISQTAGCLPMLIQMLVFFSMWPPVQAPLQYVGRVPLENVEKIFNFLNQNGWVSDKLNVKAIARNDIPIIDALNRHGSALVTAVENGWMELKQLVSLDFLGLDLGMRPTINPKLLFGPEWRTYLPLLILPLLTLITMIITMQLNKMNNPMHVSKEEREREKKNPAKAGQNPDPTSGMMKNMNIIMPIIMMFTVFSLPTAMGLFWVTRNVVTIFTTLITHYLYHRPFHQKQQAAAEPNRRKK